MNVQTTADMTLLDFDLAAVDYVEDFDPSSIADMDDDSARDCYHKAARAVRIFTEQYNSITTTKSGQRRRSHDAGVAAHVGGQMEHAQQVAAKLKPLADRAVLNFVNSRQAAHNRDGLLEQVDDVVARLERLVATAKRARKEIQDNIDCSPKSDRLTSVLEQTTGLQSEILWSTPNVRFDLLVKYAVAVDADIARSTDRS